MISNIHNALVSVIMPAYNAASYIGEAIESVFDQDHQNFELIIIDDGSTDNTKSVINSFTDDRLKVISQVNKGVSEARNAGLAAMVGDFFILLDADDKIAARSLSSRLAVFAQKDVSYVDGNVIYIDEMGRSTGKIYEPSYTGNPLPRLLKLDSSVFFGPSWMIRHNKDLNYYFDKRLSHCEDLYFYIDISNQMSGDYAFVDIPVLFYRKSQSSAMSNLKGLEDGYALLYDLLMEKGLLDPKERKCLKLRIARIMFLSYFIDGRQYFASIKAAYRFLVK